MSCTTLQPKLLIELCPIPSRPFYVVIEKSDTIDTKISKWLHNTTLRKAYVEKLLQTVECMRSDVK